MADVLMVCVREDVACAEQLADIFDARGLSIGDDRDIEEGGVGLVLISPAALRCTAFIEAAERVLNAGEAIAVRVDTAINEDALGDVAVFDLSDWDGAEEDSVAQALVAEIERLRAAPVEAPLALGRAEPFDYWGPHDRVAGATPFYFAGDPAHVSAVLTTYATPASRPAWNPRAVPRAVHASPTIRRLRPAAALVAVFVGMALAFNLAPASPRADAPAPSFTLAVSGAHAEPLAAEAVAPPMDLILYRGLEPPSAPEMQTAAPAPERRVRQRAARAHVEAPASSITPAIEAIPLDMLALIESAESASLRPAAYVRGDN